MHSLGKKLVGVALIAVLIGAKVSVRLWQRQTMREAAAERAQAEFDERDQQIKAEIQDSASGLEMRPLLDGWSPTKPEPIAVVVPTIETNSTPLPGFPRIELPKVEPVRLEIPDPQIPEFEAPQIDLQPLVREMQSLIKSERQERN